MFRLGLGEGLFECCNPTSIGEPEFLAQEQHISSRAPSSLFPSASGGLQLYFQRWQSDRHDRVRSAVFVHHGEVEHGGWFNALAVRLAAVGCTTFAPDAQGWGQSDGARGYFSCFEDLVSDFVEFCKAKWSEVLNAQSKGPAMHRPGFVLLGKGFGALVVLRAMVELQEVAFAAGVTPVVVLVSPGFRFASFIDAQSNVSCGFNSQQCARQPVAQCARDGVAYAPECAAVPSKPWTGSCRELGERQPRPGPAADSGQHQKLEQMSNWFPKMIVTQPVEPDMISRDPQTVDRMCRDALCWRQGYRSRVLAEIVQEQLTIADSISENVEIFARVPALMLHGSGDKLFAVHGSHSIHSIWCDAAQTTGVYPRLKIYDGAFHQLLNEPNREEVMNDIVLFVASKASPV
uniref:Serine aminopeptidase S33 domain-containing protein n=1 Tax=Alexandrium monilatum TaxID=311494 RepID=A0A7S4RJ35_9DINO|mmetsp:Transcript_88276/g.273527  ORF Transcript_88276/g.273527 Transcript_88276/m.273527 type:complete len:404 (+) Transcript_88276:63-1274(+)